MSTKNSDALDRTYVDKRLFEIYQEQARTRGYCDIKGCGRSAVWEVWTGGAYGKKARRCNEHATPFEHARLRLR